MSKEELNKQNAILILAGRFGSVSCFNSYEYFLNIGNSLAIDKILNSIEITNKFKSYIAVSNIDEKFADNLTVWAEVIRKTFYDGGVDEIISTRRLDHIVKAFSIFKDKMKSIELCVSRFDDDTKDSFMDLYTKIDAGEDVQGISDSDEDLDDPEDETVNEDGGAVNY